MANFLVSADIRPRLDARSRRVGPLGVRPGLFLLAILAFGEPARADFVSVYAASHDYVTQDEVSGPTVVSPNDTSASAQVDAYFNNAYSSADLASGTMRGTVNSTAYYEFDEAPLPGLAFYPASESPYANASVDSYAVSASELDDTVHFSIPGANSGSVTDIGISVHGDGSIDSCCLIRVGYELTLSFGAGQEAIMAWNVNTYSPSSLSGATPQTTAGGEVIGDWATDNFASQTASLLEFTGFVPLQGPDPSLTLDAVFDLISYLGGAYYGDTSYITFDLPPGVTFTSDSGVFLTQSPFAATAAPEPSTWAILLMGLVALGFAGCRRARSPVAPQVGSA